MTTCDPLTIAGLALGAGSVAANSAAASAQQHARDDVLAAERIRQQGYDKEAKALNTQSQDRYQGFEGQQAEKAQSLGDYFGSQSTADDPNAAAGGIMPSSSSDIVNAESSKQGAKTDAYVGQQANALANYRAFGDLLGGTSLLQARDAGLIGQIGGFKTGSSSIVPYELEDASQKGAGMGLLGDLLGGAGGVLGGVNNTGGLGSLFGGAAKVAPTVSPALGAAAAAGRAPDFLAAARRGAVPSLYPSYKNWLV